MSDQNEPQALTPEEISKILNYGIVVKGNVLFSVLVYEASHMEASKRGIKRVEYTNDEQELCVLWVYVDSRDGWIYDVVPDWDCRNPYPYN